MSFAIWSATIRRNLASLPFPIAATAPVRACNFRIFQRGEKRGSELYTAATPLYPNTFLFSDPLESRYLGWIVWKWDFDGYIRWAWTFWPATLWEQPFFTWHSGDIFFVYPGPRDPIPARMENARHLVNQVLINLDSLARQYRR